MIREFLTPEFRKFLLTGGVAAAVNLASRVAFDVVMSYSAAIVLAYASGMVTAYGLARRFVFVDATTSTAQSATRFTIVNLFGMAQTWIVSVSLAEWLLPALGIDRFAHTLAHVAGVIAPVFTSFLGHRFWTFAGDSDSPSNGQTEVRVTEPNAASRASLSDTTIDRASHSDS